MMRDASAVSFQPIHVGKGHCDTCGLVRCQPPVAVPTAGCKYRWAESWLWGTSVLGRVGSYHVSHRQLHVAWAVVQGNVGFRDRRSGAATSQASDGPARHNEHVWVRHTASGCKDKATR